MRSICFNELTITDLDLRKKLDAAYHRVMDSGWFVLGKEVKAFESEFGSYCGVEHCIGVANGLEALQLIMRAYEIGPGDEVLVPANTFIATWLAISHTGAKPVPIEPDSSTFNITAENLSKAITPATRAIIVVHLFGQPVEMNEITSLAGEYGIPVIEDACQAHGAHYHKSPVGSLGSAAAFSFYPVKNLGAYGDGGAITTTDSDLAARLMMLRNYGSPVKYQHDQIGYNSRLDELQAAFLRVKLEQLGDDNTIRRDQVNKYISELASVSEVMLPKVNMGMDPVWHQFVIQIDHRSELMSYLADRAIETMIHYPAPPHQSGAYFGTHGMLDLPVTQCLSKRILSLPIGKHLTEKDIETVIQAIKGFYSYG